MKFAGNFVNWNSEYDMDIMTTKFHKEEIDPEVDHLTFFLEGEGVVEDLVTARIC